MRRERHCPYCGVVMGSCHLKRVVSLLRRHFSRSHPVEWGMITTAERQLKWMKENYGFNSFKRNADAQTDRPGPQTP